MEEKERKEYWEQIITLCKKISSLDAHSVYINKEQCLLTDYFIIGMDEEKYYLPMSKWDECLEFTKEKYIEWKPLEIKT